jgi:hypothetical protein
MRVSFAKATIALRSLVPGQRQPLSQKSSKLACIASVAAASCWAPTESSTAPTPPELELESSPVPTRLNQLRKTLKSRRALEAAEEEGEDGGAETGAEGRRRGTGSRDSSLNPMLSNSSCSNESIGKSGRSTVFRGGHVTPPAFNRLSDSQSVYGRRTLGWWTSLDTSVIRVITRKHVHDFADS